MSLRKDYVRDGKRRIIGSVTDGFSDQSIVVRNAENRIIGRTSALFQTTRNREGSLISTNVDNPGLLIKQKK